LSQRLKKRAGEQAYAYRYDANTDTETERRALSPPLGRATVGVAVAWGGRDSNAAPSPIEVTT
jgi:hypothetical protein